MRKTVIEGEKEKEDSPGRHPHRSVPSMTQALRVACFPYQVFSVDSVGLVVELQDSYPSAVDSL